MIEDRPKELMDRQREHQRHAAIMQQPHHQEDEQEYSDDRDRDYMDTEEAREHEEEMEREQHSRHHNRSHYQDNDAGKKIRQFWTKYLGLD